jgi:hypothetical protein
LADITIAAERTRDILPERRHRRVLVEATSDHERYFLLHVRGGIGEAAPHLPELTTSIVEDHHLRLIMIVGPEVAQVLRSDSPEVKAAALASQTDPRGAGDGQHSLTTRHHAIEV